MEDTWINPMSLVLFWGKPVTLSGPQSCKYIPEAATQTESMCLQQLPTVCRHYIKPLLLSFCLTLILQPLINSAAALSRQHHSLVCRRVSFFFFFFYFRVFDLCCCFLLWAEFYTACQSPERHTLEGPVEWDTKSDASWEHSSLSPYTYPSYPLPHCLSSSSSLFLLLQTHLFPLMRILFSSPPLILLLSFSPSDASATPKTPGQLWMTPLPLCSGRLHATSVGAFSAGALGWSQPTAPSMHRSECVANEHHWRNVPTSVLFPPCLD